MKSLERVLAEKEKEKAEALRMTEKELLEKFRSPKEEEKRRQNNQISELENIIENKDGLYEREEVENAKETLEKIKENIRQKKD